MDLDYLDLFHAGPGETTLPCGHVTRSLIRKPLWKPALFETDFDIIYKQDKEADGQNSRVCVCVGGG